MKVSSKTLVFLMTLLILIVSISAVSATNVSSNQTVQEELTTQEVATSTDTNIAQETTIQNEISDVKANENKKDLKTKLKSNTYVITQSTFSDYFDSDGILVDTVADGDTLDIQGLINLTDNRMVINKSVNIVSTTHDGNISLNTPVGEPSIKNSIPYDAFVIDRAASYTNITGINIYNTIIWVRADHVTFDGVNVTVILSNYDTTGDQQLGFGTGHFSFRPGADYGTVKNSNITTSKDRSSALVFTHVLYCTATNNTIDSSGGSGNIIYINYYNAFGDENDVINNAKARGIILNSYNNITNNTIIGPAPDAVTYAIALTGSNNYVTGNNIIYSGMAIITQVENNQNPVENYTLANNTVIGSGTINIAFASNMLCENNTINNGTITVGSNTTVKGNVAKNLTVGNNIDDAVLFNNTINQLEIRGNNIEVYNNTLGSVITTQGTKVYPENVTIHDNIINGNITNEKGVNLVIENNTINGNISIARTSRNDNTNDTIIRNNTIHGQVTSDGEHTVITNNSIFTEDTYAVVGGRYANNLFVTDNLLISDKGQLTGNTAVTNRTDIVNQNNGAKISKIEITTEDIITQDISTEIQIKVTDADNQDLSEPVLVTINDEEIGAVMGSGTIVYTPTTSHDLVITATIVNSSNYYNQTSVTKEIISPTIKTIMSVSIPETTKINKTVIINGSLLTKDNQAVPDAVIDYTFNSVTGQTVTDNDGKFNVTITSEESVTSNVIFNYAGNETFSESSEEVSLTVNKLDTNLILDDIESVKVGKNVTISGKLVDEDNNPVSKVNLFVAVNNGVNQLVSTDNNGIFTYNYQTTIVSNKNNVTVVFLGDIYRYSVTRTTTFVTNKINTNINLDTIKSVNQGENITVSGSLVDEEGNFIRNADIKIVINSVSNVNTKTNNNGLFNVSTNKVNPDNNDISVIYSGNQTYNSSQANANVIVKMYSIVTVDAVEGVALDNVTITAHVTDSKGNLVTGGNIAYKVNNQNLKDSAGNQIRVPVVNGIATLSYQANAGWLYDNHPNIKVQAVYTGSSRVQANRSEDNTVKIYKRNATVKLNINSTYVDSYLHIVATVKDHNGSNADDGFFIFKLNGLTLQDENKQSIIGNVSNGVAEINCKLPFKFTAKVYTVDAIYSNKIYNKATGTTKVTVKAATVYINATVSLSNQFSNPKITGKVINKHTGEVINGDIVVSVKFDGTSYLKKVTVKNGVLNLTITGIPIYKPGNHTVEIISGASSHFEALRQQLSVKSTPKYDVVTKITKLTRTKNQTRVQATLVDLKNKNVQKDLKITIKVNGKSFLTDYTVHNGIVDVMINTSSLSNREYTLSITNGANTYYKANTNSTALPKYA